MEAVLTKAFGLVLIIVTGYLLKRRGFFREKDFRFISRIVLNLTLPCAVITNFSKMRVEGSLFALVVIGIVCNLITIIVGYFLTLRRDSGEKAFHMINLSGYNIGSFTMPFIQSFLGPVGVVAACVFDVGNATLCAGGTYVLVTAVAGIGEKSTVKGFLKRLFSSVAMDTYLIMLTISFLNLRLPPVVISFAETVGAANGFLSMLMIGVGFKLGLERQKVFRMLRIIVVRYAIALVFALVFYFVLPFPQEIRQVLAIIAFAPISSICTAFTERCGGDVPLSSAVNSVSIVASITIMTVLMICMGIGS